MWNFGIAYQDQNIKNTLGENPCIAFFGNEYTIEQVKLEYDRIVREGYANVTTFQYDDSDNDDIEKCLSWNWIMERKIDL